ncbi:MAG: hypothetical protein FWC76_06615 [Defluviitaleaceae bacterium]|nr:hypothetical protein [Defluviitaleaceae bacterium]
MIKILVGFFIEAPKRATGSAPANQFYWIASALGCAGFLAGVGLAMTVGRCVANWMSAAVKLSLRGLR